MAERELAAVAAKNVESDRGDAVNEDDDQKEDVIGAADQLRRQRERYGFSYLGVLEPAMEDFAPVIELLKE